MAFKARISEAVKRKGQAQFAVDSAFSHRIIKEFVKNFMTEEITSSLNSNSAPRPQRYHLKQKGYVYISKPFASRWALKEITNNFTVKLNRKLDEHKLDYAPWDVKGLVLFWRLSLLAAKKTAAQRSPIAIGPEQPGPNQASEKKEEPDWEAPKLRKTYPEYRKE